MRKKMIIKIISWIIFIGLVIALIVAAINIYMVTTTSKRIISVDDAKDINADCIIVLGAGVKPSGKPSWMLEDRIIVGEQLYNVNAAPKLLMSGDHGRENYDEVNTMKNYAINDGIPSEDIFMDHAGFETYDSMYRAKKIFGAKKVVISAPAGNDLPTIVYNVNHETLSKDENIISAASCTTNCLAPMADALNKYAAIQSGIMVTIHAYTGDQMTLDGPQRKGDLRRSRAAAVNIVPNSTGAAKAIGLVIPELNGKLIGSAQRVPTPTGSTTILTAVVKGKDITVDGINAAMKAAATESFGYNEDEIVSSDIVGMRYGSLFDATQTMVCKVDDDTYEVQVVSWYDNENSYTSQMVRTIKYFSELA